MRRITALVAGLLLIGAAPAHSTTFPTDGWQDRSIVLVGNVKGMAEAVEGWNSTNPPVTLSLAPKRVKSCADVAGSCITVQTGEIDAAGLAQGNYDGGPITWCTVTVSDDFKGREAQFYRPSIIVHEVGHCVGLAHAPWYEHSVMRAELTGLTVLQEYDLADLNTIYP